MELRNKMIARVVLMMRKRKVSVEALPTEDAIGTYNYLCGEGRLVGAALIPPEVNRMNQSDDATADAFLETKEFGKFDGEDIHFMTKRELLDSVDVDIESYKPGKKNNKKDP